MGRLVVPLLLLLLVLAAPAAQACHESLPWLDWEGDDLCVETACAFDGQPITRRGVLAWNWHPVSDCPDPAPVGLYDQSIRIQAERSRFMPAWLRVDVAPEAIVIPSDQRTDPAAFTPTGDPLHPILERHEVPVTLTVVLDRAPTPGEVLVAQEQGGNLSAFLGFRHSAGQMQSFAVAGFSLDASDWLASQAAAATPAPPQELPGFLVAGMPVALAVAALARRRRA